MNADKNQDVFPDRTTPTKRIVAVVPTGGRGGQMYPLTAAMPKALLPLHDRPLLVHILERLTPEFFENVIVLCDNWQPMVEGYLKAFGTRLKVPYEVISSGEKSLTVMLKQLFDRKKLSDPFLLHYCDVLTKGEIDWRAILQMYGQKLEARNILGLLLVSSYFQYPVGVVKRQSGLVTSFEEKPGSILGGHANCAIALFTCEFVENYILSNHADVFGQSVIEALRAKRHIAAYDIEDDWKHFQHISTWIDGQAEYYPHLRRD